MSEHFHPSTDLPAADSIEVKYCEHGTLFLLLKDQSGEVFATAAFDHMSALSMVADLLRYIRLARDASGSDHAAHTVWRLPVERQADKIAAEVDDAAVRIALVYAARNNGEPAAMKSIFAGLWSSAIRFMHPFRNRSITAEQWADDSREPTLALLSELAFVEAGGWQFSTTAADAVDFLREVTAQ